MIMERQGSRNERIERGGEKAMKYGKGRREGKRSKKKGVEKE